MIKIGNGIHSVVCSDKGCLILKFKLAFNYLFGHLGAASDEIHNLNRIEVKFKTRFNSWLH